VRKNFSNPLKEKRKRTLSFGQIECLVINYSKTSPEQREEKHNVCTPWVFKELTIGCDALQTDDSSASTSLSGRAREKAERFV